MMSHRFSLNEMNILDAALIASKALGSRLGSSKMNIVHKLEIEKAYDHINYLIGASCYQYGENGF